VHHAAFLFSRFINICTIKLHHLSFYGSVVVRAHFAFAFCHLQQSLCNWRLVLSSIQAAPHVYHALSPLRFYIPCIPLEGHTVEIFHFVYGVRRDGRNYFCTFVLRRVSCFPSLYRTPRYVMGRPKRQSTRRRNLNTSGYIRMERREMHRPARHTRM